MDINQKRFVDDTLDLLNELDEGLMQLESNPHATAPLEQVFRTMHTIKGGANMFGFENIGELSYRLENIFDLVRQGKLHITDSLISITLRAFDKVRDLLKENDIRAEFDDSDINLGTKVRDAKNNKLPYWIVVGDKEIDLSEIELIVGAQ